MKPPFLRPTSMQHNDPFEAQFFNEREKCIDLDAMSKEDLFNQLQASQERVRALELEVQHNRSECEQYKNALRMMKEDSVRECNVAIKKVKEHRSSMQSFLSRVNSVTNMMSLSVADRNRLQYDVTRSPGSPPPLPPPSSPMITPSRAKVSRINL